MIEYHIFLSWLTFLALSTVHFTIIGTIKNVICGLFPKSSDCISYNYSLFSGHSFYLTTPSFSIVHLSLKIRINYYPSFHQIAGKHEYIFNIQKFFEKSAAQIVGSNYLPSGGSSECAASLRAQSPPEAPQPTLSSDASLQNCGRLPGFPREFAPGSRISDFPETVSVLLIVKCIQTASFRVGI